MTGGEWEAGSGGGERTWQGRRGKATGRIQASIHREKSNDHNRVAGGLMATD